MSTAYKKYIPFAGLHGENAIEVRVDYFRNGNNPYKARGYYLHAHVVTRADGLVSYGYWLSGAAYPTEFERPIMLVSRASKKAELKAGEYFAAHADDLADELRERYLAAHA